MQIDPARGAMVSETHLSIAIDRVLDDNWALSLTARGGQWRHTLWRVRVTENKDAR
jgi:hypothetical protein